MAKSFTLLGTQSAGANADSGVLDLVDLTTASFYIAFTGSNVAGTLTLQGSVDGTTFFDYPGSSQSVTSSTGHIYDLNPTGVRYFRVHWVYTSGTGNITVLAYTKNNVVSGA
jgi:hypothetical protein